MPEDYFSDAAPPASEPTASEPATPEPEASDSETAVLPKAVLGGKTFEVGDEVVLEVTQVLEDSVVVKYASETPEEPSEPVAEEEPAAAGGGPPNWAGGSSMGSMME